MLALIDLPPVVKLAVAGIALMALACLVLGLATVGVVWFVRLVSTWISDLAANAARASIEAAIRESVEAAAACYHEASDHTGKNPLNQDSIQVA